MNVKLRVKGQESRVKGQDGGKKGFVHIILDTSLVFSHLCD